jgi:pimeloyl-ACP methyl ester carboxylesterase
VATFCLVHGAWHGGWAWDPLRAELEARGHAVAAPDLPCDDVAADAATYADVLRAALGGADDAVVVGHSLGGLTIPLVPGRIRVFLCALVPGADTSDAFVPGFGETRTRDELGRSYYPDPADAARELQYPAEAAALAEKLRPQAPIDASVPVTGPRAYVVCARDEAIRADWQRRVARDLLGVEPVELDAGHSPMLTHPRELADILGELA